MEIKDIRMFSKRNKEYFINLIELDLEMELSGRASDAGLWVIVAFFFFLFS